MELYYIKHRITGLYSSGGTGPRWSNKKPKLWTLGALKGHLNQFADRANNLAGRNGDAANWDVYCVDLAINDRTPLMPATVARNYKRPKPPKQ
jgi:hypothetical protein